MSNSVTVQLSSPISHAGTTYSELTFRKAKTGDLVAADAVTGEFAKTLAILSGMCGVPFPAMKELDLDDFAAVSEKVAPLMGEFRQPAAGSTS